MDEANDVRSASVALTTNKGRMLLKTNESHQLDTATTTKKIEKLQIMINDLFFHCFPSTTLNVIIVFITQLNLIDEKQKVTLIGRPPENCLR